MHYINAAWLDQLLWVWFFLITQIHCAAINSELSEKLSDGVRERK